jgi:hypothetical protein
MLLTFVTIFLNSHFYQSIAVQLWFHLPGGDDPKLCWQGIFGRNLMQAGAS